MIADALVLGGLSVSLAGESPEFPEVWDSGLTVTMRTPNSYTVSSVGEYDRISGPLGDLAPVGMKVTLSTDMDYDLVVASYSPYVPPVPGSGAAHRPCRRAHRQLPTTSRLPRRYGRSPTGEYADHFAGV